MLKLGVKVHEVDLIWKVYIQFDLPFPLKRHVNTLFSRAENYVINGEFSHFKSLFLSKTILNPFPFFFQKSLQCLIVKSLYENEVFTWCFNGKRRRGTRITVFRNNFNEHIGKGLNHPLDVTSLRRAKAT